MGKLTTHVLDTANGRPGAGIKVELFALSGDTRRALKTTTTNDDGRCDQPLLEGDALVAGEYELVFGAGDYFGVNIQGRVMPGYTLVQRDGYGNVVWSPWYRVDGNGREVAYGPKEKKS